MKKLLQTLTEAFGPSGYEDQVREIVRNEVKSLADEISVDALGNLSVHKHPGKTRQNAKKVMIAAHMDEVGVIVSHVDRNGFVFFSPIGSVPGGCKYIAGNRVRFLNRAQGVIGTSLDKLHIDVGASSQKDCPVHIGDVGVFDTPYNEFGDRLTAKAMDNRVGVLVAIETLRNLKSSSYEIVFVFTTQAALGRRGASAAAYGIEPDVGIALDVIPAGDLPRSQEREIALGMGPAIKLQGAGFIADHRIVDWMVRAAEKNKVPYQREVLLTEDSDASGVQFARAGVPAGCLSIPVRYLHSPSEMVDISDVQNAVKLLTAILHTPVGL